MNRREFFCAAAAFLPEPDRAIRLTLSPDNPLAAIPSDFIGLGYEISSVAQPGLLSATNRQSVDLVRALGTKGLIRIGGNTSDYSRFVPDAPPVSTSKGTVVNSANLRELGTFLDATGWNLIWGLNLGRGTEQEAVAEAEAVASAVKGRLSAFEIGNEPDLFGNRSTHRPSGYAYKDFLQDYRRYKAAIRRVLPKAIFAGPDVASATEWVQQFAADEGEDLKLLTHHYYRECAGPASTIDKLLHTDPKLAPKLEQLKAASAAARVPYRICETNSFCGGGKPGVSDTFASALWVLDFMFKLAMAGAGGVNMETGVNQLDFISHYSPIRGNTAAPEYFGMLAFAHASQGRLISTTCDAGSLNVAAYAVENGMNQMIVTIVNKEATQSVDFNIKSRRAIRHAKVESLTAESLESKEGVRLSPGQRARLRNGECQVHVPAASAALVALLTH